ncbi:serine hydrolase domain-containing protein [Microbacterium radiodurans]|uniref:serine hydrolase domain-containing protein n=1 Tax=Microbacterium radiodurans TaxID=661398 RepID=UPI001CC369D8|nr:serine hydrolase domain-containing protein [Microbacterium radiodurans]
MTTHRHTKAQETATMNGSAHLRTQGASAVAARGAHVLTALLAGGVLLSGCAVPARDVPPTGAAVVEVPIEVADAVATVMEAGAVGVAVDIRDGDTTASLAEGSADLRDDRAAQVGDPVRIASISKTVLAVVVLQLVEEGELSLDSTVQEVLPGLLDAAPADVTVQQLLAHTSGLPDYIAALAPDVDAAIDGRDAVYEPRELLSVAQQQSWLAEPGTEFHYSNAGYTVLGLMVEGVTGSTVPDLMNERVLEPVGMDATQYPTGGAMPDDSMHGYLRIDGDLVDVTDYDPSFWSFGASLVSTVGDVSAFNAALQRGDLLQPTTLEQMRAIGIEGYGLGVLAGGDACGAEPPELVFGQRGNGFGYNAITLASPDGERVVTVAYTGGSFDPATDPIFPAVGEVVAAALASTCP